MKIALVVPGGEKNMGAMGVVARPPLGVCYLKAFLEVNGIPTKVFHQIDESNEEIVTLVSAFKPSLVGFSTMSCVFKTGTKIARELKKERAVNIVFGGEHISAIVSDELNHKSQLATAEFRDHPYIDYMIPFEGEIALLNLVRALDHKESTTNIPGVVCFDKLNSRAVLTEKVQRIVSLDNLPMADRSDLPYHKYQSVDDVDGLEYLHTTRGCKYNCTYCATPVSSAGKTATNSAEHILDEIEFVSKNYGRKSYFFCDELFTTDYQRIEDFCHGILSRKLNISWRVFARVNDLTGKRQINLSLMKEAGLKGLFFGVESMNQTTLNRLNKGTSRRQIRLAIERTYQAGIDVWGSLMMGYPWESESELRKSLKDYLAMKDKIKQTYVAFITPFPGTPFYNECVVNGWVDRDDYRRTDCSTPVLKTPMEEEILVSIYKEFISQIS